MSVAGFSIHAATAAAAAAPLPNGQQVKCHACVGGTSVREDARILSAGVCFAFAQQQLRQQRRQQQQQKVTQVKQYGGGD